METEQTQHSCQECGRTEPEVSFRSLRVRIGVCNACVGDKMRAAAHRRNAPEEAGRADAPLTAVQACRFLQISDSSLRRYMRIGRLKAHRTPGGRDLRFYPSDLLALLEPVERQQAPAG